MWRDQDGGWTSLVARTFGTSSLSLPVTSQQLLEQAVFNWRNVYIVSRLCGAHSAIIIAHPHVLMHVCVYVCACVCMYECMYARMRVRCNLRARSIWQMATRKEVPSFYQWLKQRWLLLGRPRSLQVDKGSHLVSKAYIKDRVVLV